VHGDSKSGSGIEPLFELRLRTPRLELRLPTEQELVDLAHLAEQGVHPPDQMPFFVAWTDAIGTPGFVDGFVSFHLQARADWRTDHWHLLLGVWAGEALIGTQGIEAVEFPARRTAESGSWLGACHQRRGYGTEMRGAVLALVFDGLDGLAATSGALEGNLGSARVSEKLGYLLAGEDVASPRGIPVRQQLYRLERAAWAGAPVEISGLDDCLPLFGL
jgi:RimJ/RimL family protein N-acetyltransferase